MCIKARKKNPDSHCEDPIETVSVRRVRTTETDAPQEHTESHSGYVDSDGSDGTRKRHKKN